MYIYIYTKIYSYTYAYTNICIIQICIKIIKKIHWLTCFSLQIFKNNMFAKSDCNVISAILCFVDGI